MLSAICYTFNTKEYINYEQNYNEALFFLQLINNYFSKLSYSHLFSIHCDMSIYNLITIMLLFFCPLSQIIRESLSIPLLLSYANNYISCAWFYTIGSFILTLIFFLLSKVFVINKINKRYSSLNLLSKTFFICN